MDIFSVLITCIKHMGEGSLYRPILKQAWSVTKKFKSLWFLGLFAAILSSGGEFELLTRLFFSPNGPDSGIFQQAAEKFNYGLANSAEAGSNMWGNVWASVTESPESFVTAILILVVSLAITLFVIWLAVVSQVGLISNINKTEKGKKITINEGIDEGVKNFWPVLTVNILYKIFLAVVFVIIGKEVIFWADKGLSGVIIHVISLVIFGIIAVIASFLVRYQILHIVLNGKSVSEAIKSAWNLFTKNWLISLEMALIMFVVYLFAAYLTAFISALFFAIPLVFIAYPNIIPVVAMMVIGLMAFIAVFVVTFFISAFVSAFNWSAWTMLFNKIQTKGPMSSIMRLSNKSPNIPTSLRRK